MSSLSQDVALRAAELSKRFADLVAVKGLSLEVRRGEILAFLGPNGAGKTTTLRMLSGLLRPDSGTVEIAGRRLRPGDKRALRHLGIAPQDIVIWEMLTCREQLEFIGRMYDLPRRRARQRADELLEGFGLAEKAHQLGRTLSGGMQRRLNIALALVHEPAVLLLDEPQAGLDPQSRLLVRETLRALAGRMTIVLTTHDMEEAEKLADRVCIIDRGEVLVLGTLDAIKHQLGEGDLLEIEIGGEVDEAFLMVLCSVLGDRSLVSRRGRTLHIGASDPLQALPAVLEILARRGLRLEGLHWRKRTLEDVFIHLTGRGLRE